MTETYPIPAREVVPGMLMHGKPISRTWTESQQYPGEKRAAWCTATGIATVPELYYVPWPPDAIVSIGLSGPSPRQKLCTCICDGLGTWQCVMDARACEPIASHMPTCPLSPTEQHGGMRLWPTPLDGEFWVWNGQAWVCGVIWVFPSVLEDNRPSDILWCFYLPRVPA